MTERSRYSAENLTSRSLSEARSVEIKNLLHSGRTEELKNQIENEQSRTEAIRNYVILRAFVTNPEFVSESAQSYTRAQAISRSLVCLEYITKKGVESVKNYEFKETQTQIESEEEVSQENTEEKTSENSTKMAASSSTTVKVPDPNKYSSINSFYQAFKLYQKLQKLDENNTDTTLHYILAISTHPIWGDMAANLNTSEPDQKIADFHKKLAQQIEPSHVHSYNFLSQLQKLSMPDGSAQSLIDFFRAISNIKAQASMKEYPKQLFVTTFVNQCFFSDRLTQVQKEESTLAEMLLEAKKYVIDPENLQSVECHRTSIRSQNITANSTRGRGSFLRGRGQSRGGRAQYNRFQGNCFNCGLQGHRSSECRKQKNDYRGRGSFRA